MSDSVHNDLSQIKLAYHLMLRSKALEARGKGDKATEKAALAELAKDGVEISDAARSAKSASTGSPIVIQNEDIRLSDLIHKLKQNKTDASNVQQAQFVQIKESVEVEASITYYDLEPVEGLVMRNRNLAETDRYRFDFQDGSTLKITDKWSNRSTTIWGDPHIDNSDEQGANDGDFKDLKSSDRFTTFMLSDGTRLTITAYDDGIIEAVDIFKGSQSLHGVGSGSKSFDEKSSLFSSPVKNEASHASLLAVGDVVYSGGDGNDWYDAARNLVWGKTTGAAVYSRPSSYFEFQYRQTITQQISILQVDETA